MNSTTARILENTLWKDLFNYSFSSRRYKSKDKNKHFINDEGWRKVILRLIKNYEKCSPKVKNNKNKEVYKLLDEAFLDKLADLFCETYNSQPWVEEEPNHSDYNYGSFNLENYKMRVFCIETVLELYKKEKNKLIEQRKKEPKKIELQKLLYEKRLREDCLIS